jgi:hypothetical protein
VPGIASARQAVRPASHDGRTTSFSHDALDGGEKNMRTYLYTGSEPAKAVQRLAISTAGMQQRTLVVRFGPVDADDPLALWESVLPIEVVRVRLPGLDWPLSRTPADEEAVETVMAILAQIIASGDHRLVILDGIRELVSRHLLDAAGLRRLAGSSSNRTQIAMT